MKYIKRRWIIINIYDNLKSEGKILFNAFIKILRISKEDGIKIIEKNKTAKTFVNLEEALKHTSDLENIKALITITTTRDFKKCLYALQDKELNIIEKYYGFRPKIIETNKEFNNIEVLEIFERLRDVKEDSKITAILKRIVNK